MALSAELREQFDSKVNEHPVVIFMKGNRNFPQCGFSATVVDIMNELLDEYETVNVLADPEVRQGIKEYSNWPTIPQIYIQGEFVGGCDILKEMYGSGDLQSKLGVAEEEVEAPAITITDSAADVVKKALGETDTVAAVVLSINARFNYDLSLTANAEAAFTVESNGVQVLMDKGTAKRANGLTLDYVKSSTGEGFSITNPNEPPKVQPLSATDLKAMMDDGEDLALFDVRTDEERSIATIDGAVQLNEEGEAKVRALAKDARIVFQCHKGGRSQQAAEYFLGQGYTNVYNLMGGIDAWAATVDTSLDRY